MPGKQDRILCHAYGRVPAPLPTVAGHSIKTEHTDGPTVASVRMDTGSISSPQLVVLKAERHVLTKTHRTFRAEIDKLGDALVVARANRGKCVISTHGDSFDAEEFENDPVIARIQARLHHLRNTAHDHEQRLAFLNDKIGHDPSYIHIDTFDFNHHTEGASMHTSPVASHRGSASSSPVRHTSDTHLTQMGRRLSTEGSPSMLASPASSNHTPGSSSPPRHTWDIPHHTHMGRRLSTEGCSSMLASPTASMPQGGSRHLTSTSRHASTSPVRGAPSKTLTWGEEPPHRSSVRGNFE